MMLREAQLVGVGLATVVLHACFLSICVAKDHKYQTCSSSSCGDIRNISYPFRLQDDPPGCGYPEYELICENNRTMINLNGTKYYVAEINYNNHSIRVVDPVLKKGNCLIPSPLYSIDPYPDPFSRTSGSNTIVLMNCEQSIKDDKYIPIIPCNTTGYSSSSPTYAYAVVGEYASLEDIPYSCTIGTYMPIQLSMSEPSNLSMSDLQDYLLGLNLSFLSDFCHRDCEMKGQSCSYLGEDFQCDKVPSHKNCEYKMPSYLIFGELGLQCLLSWKFLQNPIMLTILSSLRMSPMSIPNFTGLL